MSNAVELAKEVLDHSIGVKPTVESLAAYEYLAIANGAALAQAVIDLSARVRELETALKDLVEDLRMRAEISKALCGTEHKTVDCSNWAWEQALKAISPAPPAAEKMGER